MRTPLITRFALIAITSAASFFAAPIALAQVTGPNGTLQQGIPPTPVMSATAIPSVSTPPPSATGTSAEPTATQAQQIQQQQLQQQQQQLQQMQQMQTLMQQQQQQQSQSQQTSPPSGNTATPPEEVARRAQQQLDAQQRGGAQPNMVEQSQTRSEIVPVLPPAQKISELRAVLRTSVGDITIKLDKVNAPETVDYFVGLARGEIDFVDIKTSKPVKRPFYNGLIFNRVVKNTLIQTGDPFGNGRGDSGKTLPDEIKPSMKFDRPGMVAMAPARDVTNTSLVKNSNSSQFFITLSEQPTWSGQFTIFGQVEDGMDVVQKIANSKVGPTERPIKRIYLVAVEIIESNK